MRLCLLMMLYLLVPNLQPEELAQTAASPPEAPYVEREDRQIKFYPGGKIDIATRSEEDALVLEIRDNARMMTRSAHDAGDATAFPYGEQTGALPASRYS